MLTAEVARRAKFEAIFDIIRDELMESCKKRGIPAEAMEWFRQVPYFRCKLCITSPNLLFHAQSLEYNVLGGKLNRGLSVVDSVEVLRGRILTEEEYLKAAVLGWCIELVSSVSLEGQDDTEVIDELASCVFSCVG